MSSGENTKGEKDRDGKVSVEKRPRGEKTGMEIPGCKITRGE